MSSRIRTSVSSDTDASTCQTATSSTVTLPLPEYTCSSCAPSYTSIPLADEETVQYNPLPGSAVSPGGTFTRRWKPLVLSLGGQEEGASIPSYHRTSLVAGELEVRCPAEVLEISLRLEGELTLLVADIGAKVLKVLQDYVLLWKKEENDARQCPRILPFALRFPSRFDDGHNTWALPPTFHARFLNFPSVFVMSAYKLTVSITRRKRCWIMSWIKHKKYNIALEYLPRHRPSRPAICFNSMFRSVKSEPEDWEQLVSTMQTKPGSGMKPIDCVILVPVSSTYTLSDAVPFHIQLSSSFGTLRKLFPPSGCLQHSANRTELKNKGGTFAIRVSITRQIVVDIEGKKTYRRLTIGRGEVRPVPTTDLGQPDSASADVVCLDWEGEVRCWKDVTCGGFNAGILHVKDFLVFALVPPAVMHSQVSPIEVVRSVRFVKDPWMDSDVLRLQD